MAEIATYTMIKTKTTYGSTSNECPTKTVIKAISSYISIANDSSYGANECVKLEDISASAYTFTVANNSKSIAAGGGTSTAVDFTSYKIVNSVQSNVSYSLTSTLPSWLTWNASARTFTAANNTGSARSFTATFTQAESGKTVTASVSQAAVSITYGEWKVSVSANPTTIAAAGGTSTITATAVRDVFTNGVKTGTDTGTPTLSISGTGFTLSGTTVTASNNTSTSTRACTVTASHGGKTATATITQSAANISYTFTVGGGASTSFAFSNTGGTSTSFTFVSTKTVNGTASNISYSQTSTLPAWLTWNSTNRQLTATANTGAERTATVTFTQAESNKTVSITVVQGGGAYVFLVDNKSSQDVSFGSGGNEGSVYITSTLNGSDTPWTAVVDQTFITLVTKNGTGSATCTFTVTSNTATTDRQGTITFTQTSSGSTVTCLVKQSGAEEQWNYNFSVNPWRVDVDGDGGSGYVGITSTKSKGLSTVQVDYDVLGSSLPSWATFNKSTSQFTIQPSTTSRTQDVYFVQDETGNRDYARLTQTVSSTWVYTLQVDGAGTVKYIDYDVNEFSVHTTSYKQQYISGSPVGDSVSVDIVATVNQSWASVSYDEGNSRPKILMTNNTSTSDRTVVVTITQNESGKSRTVTIVQRGKSADVYVFTVDGAASTSKTVAAAGGSVSTNVVSTKNGTGCPWTLYSNSASWAHPSANGTGSIALSINCDANTGTESRSAVIVYNQTGSNNRVTITITQPPQDGFYLVPSSLNTSATDTSQKTVQVVSIVNGVRNSDWSYDIMNADFNWWSAANKVGNDFVVNLRANTTSNERVGHVPFTQTGTGRTATLTITQGGGDKQNCPIRLDRTELFYKGETNTYSIRLLADSGVTPTSDVKVKLKFSRIVLGGSELESTEKTFTLLAGHSNTLYNLGAGTDDYWHYAYLTGVTPESDNTTNYSVDTTKYPVSYDVVASGNLQLNTSGIFDDVPVPVSISNALNFETISQGTVTAMKLPAKYNPDNATGRKIAGTLSCNIEARNDTVYSMKKISLQMYMTDQSSDVGTDNGLLIQTWEKDYPVGGLYITLDVNSEPFSSVDLSELSAGSDIYFYFVARVQYSGSDSPTIVCNSSSVNMRVSPI